MIGAPFECELASGVDAPRVARRLLTEWFAPTLADVTLARARLLVSELVTNAVTHGRGRITLRAQLSERRLLVEVIDEGGGFQREARADGFHTAAAGGWGLNVVDAESSRWGVGSDSSRVWFELERSGPPIEPDVSDDLTG